MAARRMFSKTITNSDPFLDMPVSCQNLYFHLGMNADDDGFVQVKSVMKQIGSNDDDLRILLVKGFLIRFGDGVIVITAWKVNNEIRGDRYKPTYYQEHMNLLKIEANRCYSLTPDIINNNTLVVPNDNQITTKCVPLVDTGKDSIGKDSNKRREKFTPPTLEEIATFCNENSVIINIEYFLDYYNSNGWMVGKNKMKDWKSTVRNWSRRDFSTNNKSGKPEFDYEAMHEENKKLFEAARK